MKNNDGKLLYKSSEVASSLGISLATLKNWSLKGKIDYLTINKHRYYTKEAIEKCISSAIESGDMKSKKK